MVIKVGTDGHLVAFKSRQAFLNDEPYALADMTPLEREAFEQMSATFNR